MALTIAINFALALLAAFGPPNHHHGSSTETQIQGSLRAPAPPGKARYYYTAESADVEAAKRTCANIYGKEYGLATLQEPADLDALKNYLLQNVSPGTELWIGGAFYEAYDDQPEEWVWDNLADPETQEPPRIPDFAMKLFKKTSETPNSVSRTTFTLMDRRRAWISFDKKTSTKRFVCEYGKGIKPTPCLAKTDISVVLDSSGSISRPDYSKAVSGSADIVRAFAMYDESRQQFLIFSDNVKEELSLLFPGPIIQKIKKVLAAEYLGRGTNTAAAIAEASRTLVANKRSGVPQAMVVITDGNSNNRDATKKAAAEAKANGIKLVAMGIGNGISSEELNNIASSPKLVFLAPNWDELQRYLEEIAQCMCPK